MFQLSHENKFTIPLKDLDFCQGKGVIRKKEIGNEHLLLEISESICRLVILTGIFFIGIIKADGKS